MQTAQENPILDLQPSQTLDCRGMVCPAPILELSKAARGYGKQAAVLEIIVDDAEFPNDLRAWCRASKNTLLNLMEDEGLFVAHVGLNIRAEEKGPPSGPRTVATSQKAPTLLSSNGEVRGSSQGADNSRETVHQLHTLDCRRMQCPAPILAVAKKAQQLGRQPALIEILATDEQFSTDLKAWCRASKAQLVNVDRIDGEIRALVAIGDVPQEVIKRAMPAPLEEVSMPLVNIKSAPEAASMKSAETALRPAVPELPKPQPAPSSAWQPLRKIELPALTPPTSASPPVATPTVPAAPKPVGMRSSPVAEPKQGPEASPAAPANDVTSPSVSFENRCTLLVTKAEVASLVAAVTYASAAAARGMDACVCFSFAAVNLLRSLQLRERPEGIVAQVLLRSQLANLEEWLSAPSQQPVKLLVCTTSLAIVGVRKHEIVALPNVQFGDVASFVDVSRRSAMTMVF